MSRRLYDWKPQPRRTSRALSKTAIPGVVPTGHPLEYSSSASRNEGLEAESLYTEDTAVEAGTVKAEVEQLDPNGKSVFGLQNQRNLKNASRKSCINRTPTDQVLLHDKQSVMASEAATEFIEGQRMRNSTELEDGESKKIEDEKEKGEECQRMPVEQQENQLGEPLRTENLQNTENLDRAEFMKQWVLDQQKRRAVVLFSYGYSNKNA